MYLHRICTVDEEVALTPNITGTPSARPFCMKDGKSYWKMALKNPLGSDGGSPAAMSAWSTTETVASACSIEATL